MSERFYSTTIQGATAVANQIQESKRPTSINESHGKLVALKALLKEFARQSPKEPLPSAMVKSALARVLPEAYHKTLTANTELDTADKTAVEDKVARIIRENTTGTAGMDVGSYEPKAIRGSARRPGEPAAGSMATSSHGFRGSLADTGRGPGVWRLCVAKEERQGQRQIRRTLPYLRRVWAFEEVLFQRQR